MPFRRFGPGPRRRRGQLVAFVTGGEPIEGCEPISTLLVGDSMAAIENRARSLGICDPHLWPNFRPTRSEADLALDDPRQFVYRPGFETEWQSSDSWPSA